MFGLTKRQFLKKSKEALKETGLQVLALRGLMNKEVKGKISLLEAQRGLDSLRNKVEDTFTSYQKLNPPSKCATLKQEVIHVLILFHESMVSYSESLQSKEDGKLEESANLLNQSQEKLIEYKELSLPVSKEVDSHLRKK